MDVAVARRIRGFNRTVTQRIGALDEAYLARERPLGASRVLWEIGPDGLDLGLLRARLDLDSGYLSRLLRRLERERLIVVEPSPADRRARVARLTKDGRAERRLLDRRSDELAWSLLDRLDDKQRERLLEAMGTVERLLTAGLIDISVDDPTSSAAQYCFASYIAELQARFDTGFDPAHSIPADPHELVEPHGLVLIARLRDEPVGCGALKLHPHQAAEIKRMWVAPTTRGLGLGRRLLHRLEQHALEHGANLIHLETNQALTEAIRLYHSAGYAEVEPFNSDPYAHHWFEKHLARGGGSTGPHGTRRRASATISQDGRR
jgi:DNA-binding MarR family transcriptional regulator/predicted N-acetyltransferase YhbS